MYLFIITQVLGFLQKCSETSKEEFPQLQKTIILVVTIVLKLEKVQTTLIKTNDALLMGLFREKSEKCHKLINEAKKKTLKFIGTKNNCFIKVFRWFRLGFQNDWVLNTNKNLLALLMDLCAIYAGKFVVPML